MWISFEDYKPAGLPECKIFNKIAREIHSQVIPGARNKLRLTCNLKHVNCNILKLITPFHNIPLAEQVVLIIYGFAILIQLLYLLVAYSRLLWHKPPVSRNKKVPVSVVICAKNEEENLKKNLPLILEQDYPDFEVVVVNDCSSDGTEDLLDSMQSKYPALRYTTIKEDSKFKHGKKLALTIGIKSAKHDIVLLTDADCYPSGPGWIRNMQSHFTRDVSVVLGYGGYEKRKGLLNLLIRFETVYIGIQYLSLALLGLPYMGTGRNLAYRRSLFFENKGFANHMNIMSGDDDLFINEVARKANTRIELRPGSLTWSHPVETWKSWFRQKKRHLSTGPHYRTGTKLILALEMLTRILVYAGFIYLLCKSTWLLIIIAAFMLRLILFMVIFKVESTRLNEKYLLLPSPILDLVVPLVNIFIHFTNFVAAKRSRWK